jgi:hypothetical protein
MSKPIVLSDTQWDKLKARLYTDNKPSVMLMSYKMKEVLGFTVRTHSWYDEQCKTHRCHICLDFYNDSIQTMFRLRYSEYLQKESITNNDIF